MKAVAYLILAAASVSAFVAPKHMPSSLVAQTTDSLVALEACRRNTKKEKRQRNQVRISVLETLDARAPQPSNPLQTFLPASQENMRKFKRGAAPAQRGAGGKKKSLSRKKLTLKAQACATQRPAAVTTFERFLTGKQRKCFVGPRRRGARRRSCPSCSSPRAASSRRRSTSASSRVSNLRTARGAAPARPSRDPPITHVPRTCPARAGRQTPARRNGARHSAAPGLTTSPAATATPPGVSTATSPS